LAAAQRNDRQAQNELVRRYEPLVQATVRRMRLPQRVDREDIVQEARLGVWDAIVAWSPGRAGRATFAGFAARCVFYRVLAALNRAGRQKHRIIDNACEFELSPGWRPARSQQLADPESLAETRELFAAVLAALPTLTHKERTVLAGMLNGRSRQELADELGATKKAISLALRRARDKLLRVVRARGMVELI
jgi:RNA polymerase sigma factor (sigma-70 family)